METPTPTWLEQSPLEETPELTLPISPARYAANIALVLSIYDNILDNTLERLSAGHLLRDIIIDHNESHPDKITAANYRTWILKDKSRKAQFSQALEIGSYAQMDEAIHISDAKDDPMEDVARSALRVKTRLTAAKAYNKKVFGDDSSISGGGMMGSVTINIPQVVSPYANHPALRAHDIQMVEIVPNE
jgi:hypothetical protein